MAEPNILDPGNGGNPGAPAQGGDLLGNPLPGAPAAAPGVAPAAEPQRAWKASLTDPALKASKGLDKFVDLDGLAKSYLEAESKIGKSVTIPAQDAPPEDWAKYYDKVGRPKSPDEYAINRGKVDDVTAATLKKASHDAGLRNDQADRIFSAVSQLEESRQRAQEGADVARRKEAESLLRAEYGPRYDAAIKDASTAYKVLFDEATRKEIAESKLASNPCFIKALAALGPQLASDSFLQGVGNAGVLKEKDSNAWMDKKYGPGSAR